MPSREEMVAAVEAVLRSRYFELVPRVDGPERANWSDEQHEVDRLSRALAAHTVAAECGVDTRTAAAAVTDGQNDGGLDAVYYERPAGRLLLVQSKFKRTGTAPSQEETLKFINGARKLMQRRFDAFNAAVQEQVEQIELALDTAGTRLELVLAFLGEAVNQHAARDLDDFREDSNSGFSEVLTWRAAGIAYIHGQLVAEQRPSRVDVSLTLENWARITAPRRAVYGQVGALHLANLVEAHAERLFERNIRHYLGSLGLNVAIEETVRRRPEEFFYLNNGITAIASVIQQSPGTTPRCTLRCEGFSIVNGAQTAGAILNAKIADRVPTEAKLLLTIIEVGANDDEVGTRITRARNSQNTVRGVDFAALDPTQERLRRELAVMDVVYHYRPSAEARAPSANAVTLEEAALALACVTFPVLSRADIDRRRSAAHAVDFVVTAKRELGRLWEQGGNYYTRLFHDGISGMRVLRAVRMYRAVDRLLAEHESTASGYYRRQFFRHGRYLIMAIVAQQSSDLLARCQSGVAGADADLLSRRVDDLSELIYAECRPTESLKGYLSTFRNLADVQPIADRVLERLAEQALSGVA